MDRTPSPNTHRFDTEAKKIAQTIYRRLSEVTAPAVDVTYSYGRPAGRLPRRTVAVQVGPTRITLGVQIDEDTLVLTLTRGSEEIASQSFPLDPDEPALSNAAALQGGQMLQRQLGSHRIASTLA